MADSILCPNCTRSAEFLRQEADFRVYYCPHCHEEFDLIFEGDEETQHKPDGLDNQSILKG